MFLFSIAEVSVIDPAAVVEEAGERLSFLRSVWTGVSGRELAAEGPLTS